ncbi:ATP-binding protein [Paraflavitalea sp. CAU 1676]|uniref:ATP-binding protein n=1 Tax=Paraflavitalea sp. CAU 1676 TaxID=3032598 RepID=UPI0023DC4242|nr:ATP-binding protein [Paraflavitalea sp. CAU 1676]MDF2190498.1 ATP-binding protein [Paraflavitalea sp. CAU 1676]
MTPSSLAEYLHFAFDHRFPVLIKGKPGIGKSDIVSQAANATGAELIISHPVVSDPTDYKGLPFPNKKGTADFLPFGDLHKIIAAKEPTIFFLDDLGQASTSVQAACMQLLLARRINDHKVSDAVTFVSATNRREDKAGVGGLLEPIKSRFASIIELEVDAEDWINWALVNDMPIELIAFIKFRPNILTEFTATKEIVNSPSPRTITSVGRQQKAGLSYSLEFEVFKGAAGETFAIEYSNFLTLYRHLPSLDEIIMNPHKAPVPDDPGILYAIGNGLANKMSEQNIGSISIYLKRFPEENAFACMTAATIRDRSLRNTKAFIQWAADYPSFLN